MDFGDAIAIGQREADVAEAVRRGRDQLVWDQRLVELLRAEGLAGFKTADSLAQRFFERAADSHHFAHRLHLRAQRGVRSRKLFESPLRDLRDYVIDGRLKTRRRLTRDVIAYLVEPVTHRELRRDLGDGETRGLRSQRGTPRYARIHFDDHHPPVLGVDGELHIRAARIDADLAQAAQRAVAHHLVFAVGESLRGGHGDRVASVHAHRIEVFDGANDDAVVGKVAHHLELVLFPPERALFHQHFMYGRKRQAALQDFNQILFVVGDAAAGAA